VSDDKGEVQKALSKIFARLMLTHSEDRAQFIAKMKEATITTNVCKRVEWRDSRIWYSDLPDMASQEFWNSTPFAPSPQPRIEFGIGDHVFTEQEQIEDLEKLWNLESPDA
jgi:hypothetical protein